MFNISKAATQPFTLEACCFFFAHPSFEKNKNKKNNKNIVAMAHYVLTYLLLYFSENESESERILLEATQMVNASYHIAHSTIQIEKRADVCHNSNTGLVGP